MRAVVRQESPGDNQHALAVFCRQFGIHVGEFFQAEGLPMVV